MPVTLTTAAGSQTSDNYTDALTLGPAGTIETIQFTVAGNTVLAQVARLNRANKPVWDYVELPFAPGQWGIDKICGIRFRSAFSGAPATVNVVGYFTDDAVPFGNANVAGGANSFFTALTSAGFLAWTTDPSGPIVAKGFTNGAGDYLYATLIERAFNQGEKITGLIASVTTAAAGTLPTACKLQLATIAHIAPPGNDLLTIVADGDARTIFQSHTGLVEVPFSTPYISPSDGKVLYAVLSGRGQWGTTNAQLSGTTPDSSPTIYTVNRLPFPLVRYQSITSGAGILGVGSQWSTWSGSSPNCFFLAPYS